MNKNVFTNNKWLDEMAVIIERIQKLCNVTFVDCLKCTTENQFLNPEIGNSSYEVITVINKFACGHDIKEGVSFLRMVNDTGKNFELLGEEILECWVHKEKACEHHFLEAENYICYKCKKLKSKIIRIDNVNVCSLICLKDYLNEK